MENYESLFMINYNGKLLYLMIIYVEILRLIKMEYCDTLIRARQIFRSEQVLDR